MKRYIQIITTQIKILYRKIIRHEKIVMIKNLNDFPTTPDGGLKVEENTTYIIKNPIKIKA